MPRPRSTNGERRAYVRKPGLSIPLDDAQVKAFKDMTRAMGVSTSDYMASEFGPLVAARLSDFAENREKIAAKARLIAAQAAVERARNLAAQAEQELAALETA